MGKLIRGWHQPTGMDQVHWFRRQGAWFRSLCGLLILELWEQDHFAENVRKCSACSSGVEERENRGLPI